MQEGPIAYFRGQARAKLVLDSGQIGNVRPILNCS